jgi:nucleotide-binding universal stress UspA family protein
MIAYRHVLAPIDLSDSPDRALEVAIDMALAFKARLTLLHVWNVPALGYAEGLSWPIDDLKGAARTALEEVRARVAARVPDVEAVLDRGLEWERILDAVEKRNVDLVVMGTHGRRGLPRLVLGSVAEKVVRMCPVPVMTVAGARPA